MISATREGEMSSSSLSTTHPCRVFSFAEIQSISRNFDDDLVIGEGGFGKVYKGQISTQQPTQFVAIKRLDSMSSQGEAEFKAEINMLTKLRHCNLVSLIGYCNDNKEMILVYDYMPNGTLHHHLHRAGTFLSWVRRLKIAIGAARGLDYLHTGVGTQYGVIHRDVKTSNILLDENWDAMVSDFGLSKIGPTNQLISHIDASVKGTFGYLDPVYFYTKKLTRKTDVYAFGVVLFELLSGRLPIDERYEEDEQCSLVLWAEKCVKERKLNQLVDFNIKGTIATKCLKRYAQIAYRCVHSVPKERPTMTELVASLQALLELQEKSDHFNGSSAAVVGFNWKIRTYFTSAPKPNAEEDLEVPLGLFVIEDIHLRQLKRFSLRELQVATDNFNKRNILGRGGASNVYKGRLADGTLVAVKRLRHENVGFREFHFQAAVGMISMAVHRNVLRLKGFCMTTTERMLVYPFMANGSVASCLREKADNQEPLDWSTRKRIALGSAMGLGHLHNHVDQKIVHRDVKAANILLDEEFEAIIGDFDLSKFMDNNATHFSTAVRGTIGHIAPEYLSTGKCTEKADVFGYGMMLLELITGQRAFDLARLANDEDVMLLDWVKRLMRENKLETLVDADLKGNYIDVEVEQMYQVAHLCTQRAPLARPNMSEVVRMLEGDGLAERWEEWKKEMFGYEFNSSHTMFADWIIPDSTNNLRAIELSGPRWIAFRMGFMLFFMYICETISL